MFILVTELPQQQSPEVVPLLNIPKFAPDLAMQMFEHCASIFAQFDWAGPRWRGGRGGRRPQAATWAECAYIDVLFSLDGWK